MGDLNEVLAKSLMESPSKIPLTLHHPENDLPVFGYADKNTLRVEPDGDRYVMTVEVKDFAKEFMDILRSAGLNKVSVGLTANKALKHIGLVDKPAVAGLGYAFDSLLRGEGDEEYEFSISPLLENDKAQPKQLTLMEDKKAQELAQTFAAEKAALEKKLADAEALVAQAKAEKEKAEAAAREAATDAEIAKFFDEEAKGRLTPKAEAHLKRVMKAISGGAEYEFAEEGKVVKATPTADLKAFIKALPVIYKQGETATVSAADGGAQFAKQDLSKMTPEDVKKAAMAKLKKQYGG